MSIKKVSPEKLHEKMNNSKEELCLLDVRSEEKFHQNHIETASQSINIFKKVILEADDDQSVALSQLPKDKEIIVTCTTGNSASKCAAVLNEKGYNVSVLEGGITNWMEYKRSNN